MQNKRMAQKTHPIPATTTKNPPPQLTIINTVGFMGARCMAVIKLIGATPIATATAVAPVKRRATLITMRTILNNKGWITLYDSLIFTACPKWTRETAYTVAPVANDSATRYATTRAMIHTTTAA